jgi:hypothetical protein
MPRGQLTKDTMKCEVLKIKDKLYKQDISWTSDPKLLAHQYLNMVLDKIEEYNY